MKQLLKYLSCLFILPAMLLADLADTEVASAGKEPVSSVSELDLFQVVMPMLMVVSLIFLLAWLIKRFNPNIPAMGKDIELLSSTPLSSQSRLSLVRVGGKDILIGITPHTITLIKAFDEQVVDTANEKGHKDLAEQFKKLLHPSSESKKSSESSEK